LAPNGTLYRELGKDKHSIASLICSPVAIGYLPHSWAAIPVTNGAAIDVPDFNTYEESLKDVADQISEPGA
jgi:hypothetical protein